MSFIGRDAWTVLGRLALLALHGQLSIERIQHTSSGRALGFNEERSVRVHTVYKPGAAIVQALVPGTLDDQSQSAEASALAWAEVHQELAAQLGWSEPVAPPRCIVLECPTCGVGRDFACVPVHEGERMPGTWAHPSRRAWHREHENSAEKEWRPDTRAADAVRWIRNHWLRGANHQRAATVYIRRLCDHVEALARRDALGIQETAQERGNRIHREIEAALASGQDDLR